MIRAAVPLVAFAAACAPVASPAPIAEIAGTDWRVVAVNGHATPAVGDYSMRFGRDGRVGIRLGCNHMGGTYRMTGGTLLLSDFATTLIGCPEPSATFERDGSRILSEPLHIAFTSNERMTLSNAQGSIALDPLP